ncbi:GAF domain-containing protein [Streptomyces aurantiacus]|uniref:GAF domain-containing protein n=1 Tax=Streptomyces aurantiacus TaxID=47760 RepID=A0A7G1P492_9ACTN|nr:GAF domain-containing protein [Streptomyces aurantiacus]BCL28664.1 GAF domain-containing protein [Streptomyces aurantiacus]
MEERQDTAAWKRVVEVASAAGRPVALESAVTACVEDMGADGLGISLITPGQIRTVAHASDERSHRLEDAQLVSGEGPCTDAYLRRRIVETDVRPAGGQWPVFMRTAGELGIHYVVAAPLLVGNNVPVGAMDIYRTTSVPLRAADRARIEVYARIFALLALDAHPALIGWEQAVPETGPVGYPPLVHQAAGAAAETADVPVTEALARMRAHAFSHQQLLEDIARDILTGRLRLEEDRDTPPG